MIDTAAICGQIANNTMCKLGDSIMQKER